MSSISLQNWISVRAADLDEIENAHRSVGGSARGRRYMTQQINHAYAMLLCSQFQGSCRDLRSEAIDHIVQVIPQVNFRHTVSLEFQINRKLDRGNPTPGNIGSDFNRLGIGFWDRVALLDVRNAIRKSSLEDLNRWRNAIAHQDFDRGILGPMILHLGDVRNWRGVCDALAINFDEVMQSYIQVVAGHSPW